MYFIACFIHILMLYASIVVAQQQQQRNSKANQTKRELKQERETEEKEEEKRFTLFISIRTHRRIDMKKGKRNPFFLSLTVHVDVACAHAHAFFKCYC